MVLRKNILIFILNVGVIVLFDRITKLYILSGMTLHNSYSVIEGLFDITYIRNPGAAFGILSAAPPFFRSVFFIVVTVLAIFLILYYLRKSEKGNLLQEISLSLIMGGALGNLMDRILYGEVIDFLDFYVGSHHWPAFNVADSAISIGAAILIITMLGGQREI
jgi:signal peptidase II